MASPVDSPREAALRQARRLGLAGVGVAAATTVLYLIVLAREGDAVLNVYSGVLVTAQVVAGFGALAGNRTVITAGATLLTLLGLLGLASIGIPLLIAAGLLWATVALLR